MQVTDEMVAAFCRANPHHHDLSVNEIRYGLTAALGAMWRPISEAPKDSRLVVTDGENWGPAIPLGGNRYMMWCSFFERFDRKDDARTNMITATHFTPPPSPPAQEEG